MKNEYRNGLLKSIEIMIVYIEKQITFIKNDSPQSNSPRQITNGGKLNAFNKMLSILKARKENILKKE